MDGGDLAEAEQRLSQARTLDNDVGSVISPHSVQCDDQLSCQMPGPSDWPLP